MVLPSGDISGHVAPPVVVVSRRQAVDDASTAISYRLNGPSLKSAAATIARPSGRHAGVTKRVSGPAAIVRTTRVSISIKAISDSWPIACRSTAIVRPSGDHRGTSNCVSVADARMTVAGG